MLERKRKDSAAPWGVDYRWGGPKPLPRRLSVGCGGRRVVVWNVIVGGQLVRRLVTAQDRQDGVNFLWSTEDANEYLPDPSVPTCVHPCRHRRCMHTRHLSHSLSSLTACQLFSNQTPSASSICRGESDDRNQAHGHDVQPQPQHAAGHDLVDGLMPLMGSVT